jgi:mono/diheme cytochrome c family protein
MLCRLMRRPLLLLALPVVAAAAVACGSEEIDIAKDSPNYNGAEIFHERCAGCHSLNVAGAQGSAVDPNQREYKDGPNFDQREEDYDQILYAIRNGGFSSSPMPQNLVTGEEAEKVADFVAKYSGSEAASQPGTSPGTR